LDRPVLEEELLVVFKFLNAPLNFKQMLTGMLLFREKGWKLPCFSQQPLCTAKRV
jgi:hypothetical protein